MSPRPSRSRTTDNAPPAPLADFEAVIFNLDGIDELLTTSTPGLDADQVRRRRQAFEGLEQAIALVERLHHAGHRMAVVSSRHDGSAALETAGLVECFDAHIDTTTPRRARGATGKLAPSMFVEAARRLQVAHNRALVVVDTPEAADAARRGKFPRIVGLGRDEEAADALQSRGATHVVEDLAALTLEIAFHDDLPDARAYVDHIGASEIAVFINFDCCLQPPPRPRPTQAVEKQPRPDSSPTKQPRGHLPESTRNVLRELARLCRVAVFSARDAEQVRRWLDVEGVTIAGNHGFEIIDPTGRRIDPHRGDGYLPALAAAAARLAEDLASVDGVRFERKRFGLSVHFEHADAEQARAIERIVDAVLERHLDLECFHGKGVLFIIPSVDWNVGRAVEWLLDALSLERPGITPMYIGGTPTDESAFEALAERGIGIVIGSARGSQADFRLHSGALIPEFLAELTARMRVQLRREGWELVYDHFDPESEKLRETLCALGNGYYVTRAAAPEAVADGVHYPGTYLAGVYNRLETERNGIRVENEDLVNFPNWQTLQFRVDDGDWIDLRAVDIEHFEQRLDMKRGVLHRTVVFCDRRGRTTRLDETRLAHMADRHLAALQTHVTAVDWSGELTVRSLLDARVTNDGTRGYRGLARRHLECVELGEVDAQTVALRVRTGQSRIEVAQAARTHVFAGERIIEASRQLVYDPGGLIGHQMTLDLAAGQRLTVEKVVAIHSNRDYASFEASYAANKRVRRAGRFDDLIESHTRAWNHIWRRIDIGLATNQQLDDLGDPAMVLRLHVFHLVQTTSPNIPGLDVGIPARGWHGEAYRGHVFWDELFVFPLLNLRAPTITRELLMYRYRRLDESRARAQALGHTGALYAWESASDGEERTPRMSYDVLNRNWYPEHTFMQRHIGAAVVYNVWQHYQATTDLDFLESYGSEIILEVARFYASLARYNDELDCFEIWDVVGPDEYHARYPGTDELGVRNNAYTNIMAAWVACRALDVLRLLPRQRAIELYERLHLRHSEIVRLEQISRKMRVLFFEDGIIEQFEGYASLDELDWARYEHRLGGDLQAIASVLAGEGDDVNRYKVSKQADVLMLFYLFSSTELIQLFGRLGYHFDEDMMRRNIAYYLERTAHGSSLSRIVHTWVLAKFDLEQAWKLFTAALASDVADTRGGTTSEGIHLGAMAGTVDIVERVFVGIEVHEDALWFNPALPAEVDHIHLNLRYRGHMLAITLDRTRLRITSADTRSGPIRIGFRGHIHHLHRYQTLHLHLD